MLCIFIRIQFIFRKASGFVLILVLGIFQVDCKFDVLRMSRPLNLAKLIRSMLCVGAAMMVIGNVLFLFDSMRNLRRKPGGEADIDNQSEIHKNLNLPSAEIKPTGNSPAAEKGTTKRTGSSILKQLILACVYPCILTIQFSRLFKSWLDRKSVV